jgi:hypothetical protein
VAAGKPIADDQVEDMVEEKQPLAHLDAWVKRFAGHVGKKGLVPDIKTLSALRKQQPTRKKRKSDCGCPSAIAAFMQAMCIWEIGR